MAVGRRRRSRVIPRWLVFLVIVAGVFIWGRGAILSPLVAGVPVEPVTYEVRMDFTAFSLYREHVLFAPLSGKISPLAADGEWVDRNAAVVRLENPDAGAAYRERLDHLLLEAEAWRRAHEKDLAAASARAAAGGESAFDAVLDLKQGHPADPLGQAALTFFSARREVLSLLAQWSERLEPIESLKVLAERMEDSIRSPRAGIVRTSMDGLEGILDWDAPLTLELTEELLRRAEEGVSVWHPGRQITAGTPAVRILDPRAVDALLMVAPEDASSLSVQGSVRVEAEGAEQAVTAQVTEIGPPGAGRVLVRASLEQTPAFFFNNRLWRASLTAAELFGLRIPPSALSVRGEDVGVFTRRDGRLRWVPVDVLMDDEEGTVIAGIPEGVQVVSNPWLIRVFRLEWGGDLR